MTTVKEPKKSVYDFDDHVSGEKIRQNHHESVVDKPRLEFGNIKGNAKELLRVDTELNEKR